jgi:hypothetical protein
LVDWVRIKSDLLKIGWMLCVSRRMRSWSITRKRLKGQRDSRVRRQAQDRLEELLQWLQDNLQVVIDSQ